MDKLRVMAALRDVVGADLRAVERMAKMATDEATNVESKPENEYDTRSLEASYLARGQAERVGALKRLLGFLESARPTPYDDDTPLGLHALVELEDPKGTTWVFIAPAEGGRVVDVDGTAIRLVTPQSPLGEAIMGRLVGESVTLETPGDLREIEIVSAS